MAVWAHPLDVHYLCRGLSGWPKLHIQVWSLDKHGRADICEQAVCRAPAWLLRWSGGLRLQPGGAAAAEARRRPAGSARPPGHSPVSSCPAGPARRRLRLLPRAHRQRHLRARLPHLAARGELAGPPPWLRAPAALPAAASCQQGPA
jgi:hypothetical protein